LLALLLPDPHDENCPPEFIDEAKALLDRIPGKTKQLARSSASDPEGRKKLREALLSFIGDFANWDLSSDRDYLEVSRGLVKSAHREDPPLVVDPFAGGGSIPLEALRLGCDAFASDLNPVACLILRTMLQDIPQAESGLADQIRRVGAEINSAAEKELEPFYPKELGGAKPIGYLWARTVKCETPNCGAEIPLVRSFWLCKKASRKRALRFKITRETNATPRVEFEIFEPTRDTDVPKATVSKAKATCICCNMTLLPDRVRAQLREISGGADVIFDDHGKRVGGARLLAVVTVSPTTQGRSYRTPSEGDYEVLLNVALALAEKRKSVSAFDPIPDEPLPKPTGAEGSPLDVYYNFIPARLYGLQTWGDLFTIRQQLALTTIVEKVAGLKVETTSDRILKTLMTLAVGRISDQMSSLVRWLETIEAVASTFGRQALPIVWHFVEIIPVGVDGANFESAVEWIAKVAEKLTQVQLSGAEVQQADAASSPLPSDTCAIWFTDPPYYDAVPYAHLSDFFLVWFKRVMPQHPLLRDPFDPANPLSPKSREIIDDLELLRGVRKDRAKELGLMVKDRSFFEGSMARAFSEGRRVMLDNAIGCVVFAHKTTEGWEALLSGIIRANLVISASWPITTERSVRMRARESAALAGSVHLICRPRTHDSVGDWAEVLRELPRRVGDWMERLQNEGIRGADLVFACIGPALEVYSQFAKVVDAEEREIPLGGDPEAKEAHERGYLAYVWEVVGRTALEQVLGTAEAKARNGAAGALEEDARLTALFLWTLQSTNGNEAQIDGEESEEIEEVDTEADDEDEPKSEKKKGFTLIYDVARRFAQPLGIHLEDWEDRIIQTKKGIVRLLPVSERAKQLFGEEGMQTIASELERGSRDSLQMSLYADLKEREIPKVRGRRLKTRISTEGADRGMQTRWEPTTLDRVHAAMLLQASGRANALRALLEAEQERGPDFLRLANALSALYPKDAEEKRLLDAMLLAVPR
jgi:adenine-specific DNA methylase